jgi:hypothetical protein
MKALFLIYHETEYAGNVYEQRLHR